MATTPNFGLPLYEPTDTAKLDTLLNGQSTALDTSLQAALEAAIAGINPFPSVQVHNSGTGTVTNSSAMGALTGISVSASVSPEVACRAKVTLTLQGYVDTPNSAFSVGVAGAGATTFTPATTDAGVVRYSGISSATQPMTLSASRIVDLNPGTTTFSVVGRAEGASGTRSARFITLTVEPVAE